MASHFPEGYEVVREEEAVTGEIVDTEEDFVKGDLWKKGPFSISSGTSHATTTTTQQKEWHIHYRRAGSVRPASWAEPAPTAELSREAR